MNTPLKHHKLINSQMEKNTYVVVRLVNNFKFYVLHSNCFVHIPDLIINNIFTQQKIGCNTRGGWIAKAQEYAIKLKQNKVCMIEWSIESNCGESGF